MKKYKDYIKSSNKKLSNKKSSNKNIDDKVIMKNVTKILSPLKETYEFYEEYEQDECRQEIAYGITNEIFTHCVNILKKHVNESEKDNNNILRPILNKVMNIILNKVSPYLYSIMAILIIMFFMNCFQFYYYIKMMLATNIKDTSFN